MDLDPEQPQLSDIELTRAIARGEAQALASLYDRYHAIFFGFLIRILRNQAEAEEVLQETFLQVWQRASDFDENRGRPFTWMVNIAHSRAIDRLRSLDSRYRMEARANVIAPASNWDGSEDIIRLEQAEMVHRALAEISEEQREALLLAYLEGLSQSEIAMRIDKPIGTVKTRMRTGLRKLREALRKKMKTGR